MICKIRFFFRFRFLDGFVSDVTSDVIAFIILDRIRTVSVLIFDFFYDPLTALGATLTFA